MHCAKFGCLPSGSGEENGNVKSLWQRRRNDDDNDDQRTNFDQKNSFEPLAQWANIKKKIEVQTNKIYRSTYKVHQYDKNLK